MERTAIIQDNVEYTAIIQEIEDGLVYGTM